MTAPAVTPSAPLPVLVDGARPAATAPCARRGMTDDQVDAVAVYLAARCIGHPDPLAVVKLLQAARPLHLAPPADGWQAVREAMEAQLEQ